MSLSYPLLGTIVSILILFIYLVWVYVSSKYVWKKRESEVAGKKNNRRWKNFVDKKNEELGWFDLGNHIIILGIIIKNFTIAIKALSRSIIKPPFNLCIISIFIIFVSVNDSLVVFLYLI